MLLRLKGFVGSIISSGTSRIYKKTQLFRRFGEVYSRRFCSKEEKSLTFFREFSEDDIIELRNKSLCIMSDDLCRISEYETQKYLVTLPKSDRTPFQELLYKIHGCHQEYEQTAWKMIHLIFERLENEDLTTVFNIDECFNKRAYFYILHVWIFHRRLMLEGVAGEIIDDFLFKKTWDVFKDWLLIKEIPEYKFCAELQNCQEYMFGLCVSLDEALERVDILPARIKEALWANLYEGEIDPDSEVVELLTKYVIRQLTHILQINQDHFLLGFFVWSNFPVLDKELNPPIIPALAQKIVYGGYRIKGGSKYLPYGSGTRLIPESRKY